MVHAAASTLAEQLQFIIGPMFHAILRTLAASISISVFDLECRNNVVSKIWETPRLRFRGGKGFDPRVFAHP